MLITMATLTTGAARVLVKLPDGTRSSRRFPKDSPLQVRAGVRVRIRVRVGVGVGVGARVASLPQGLQDCR